ncbi:MAG: hypothetical protein EOO75_06430 [Myxococcales bacterium]|nr:MAG: hypothetical protein EOO75_06430 [Myxococcales bacterium]
MLRSVGVGEPCRDSFVACNATSYCGDETCLANPREGEACSTDFRATCTFPSYCDGSLCRLPTAPVCP